MKRLEPISDDAMVLAFLKAEMDSHIYGPAVEAFCQQRGCDRTLIDDADLSDEAANRVRREALGDLRGFGRNGLLFADFPTNVSWQRARITVGELAGLKYAGWPDWVKLTHGSRLVSDGSKNCSNPFYASEPIRVHVPEISEALRAGARLAELILVGLPESDDLVLLEGHKRATAYVLTLDPSEELDVIVGSSESMDDWRGWRPFLTLSFAGLPAS